MKELFFNELSFAIEYLKLMPMLFLFFGLQCVPKKNALFITSGSIVILTILFLAAPMAPSTAITAVIFGCAFAMLEKKKHIFIALLTYIYISLLDMIFNGFIMYFCGLDTGDVQNGTWMFQLVNTPSLLVIALIIFIKRLRWKSLRYTLSADYMIVLIAGGLATSFYITSIQLIAFSNEKVEDTKSIALALGVCSLIFIFIIMMLMGSKAQNESLKKENGTVKQMSSALEEYYLMLLKKEEETKAFRHDIKGHLYCMNALFAEGKYDECKEYLADLSKGIEKIKSSADTGNDLMNAIINDLSGKYPAEVKIKGHMPSKLSVPSYDLCTIFFNVLKNAFEGAEKAGNKNIDVLIKTLGTNLIVEVTNRSFEVPKHNGKCYLSCKKENGHGYGIANVRECLDKIGGEFRIRFENGLADAEIFIPDAIRVEI